MKGVELRLAEFLTASRIDSVRVLDGGSDEIPRTIANMGVQHDDSATAFITLVEPTESRGTISLSDLADALAANDNLNGGVLMVPEDAVDHFPWNLLAQTLAKSGWTADTVVELDYEHIRRVVVISRGPAAPWVNPALGPLPPLSDRQSQFLSLFTPSLYVLERFDDAVSPTRRSAQPLADNAKTESRVLRERRRLEAEYQSQLSRAAAREAAASASSAEATTSLRELRESKRFLLGSFLVEAGRRPRRAGSISKKLVARKIPLVSSLDEELHEPVPVPSFPLKEFVQPPIASGSGRYSIAMIASPQRRSTWAAVSQISMPITGRAVAILESAPRLLVIEASALLVGRWGGIGQIAETMRSIELLDLLDAASTSGIPSIFVWDVPPGVAPGCGQIARASSVVVASDSVAAQLLEIPMIDQSVDVADAARSALTPMPLLSGALVIDSEQDVSLGGLPVRTASSDAIIHGIDQPHLHHEIVWFGQPPVRSLLAAAAARGAGIASAIDPFGLPARDRPAEYRHLTGDEREAMALDLVSRAHRSLAGTQRSLYLKHHPSVEIAKLSAIAGHGFTLRERIGVVVRCDRDDPALGSLLRAQVVSPDEVLVIDEGTDAVTSTRPSPEMRVVGTDEEALRHMRQSEVDGWLVVHRLRDGRHLPNAVLDAARFLSYGIEEIQITNLDDSTANVISSSLVLGLSSLNSDAHQMTRLSQSLHIPASTLGWTT